MELDKSNIRDTLLVINKLKVVREKFIALKHPIIFFLNLFIKINLHLVVECTLKKNKKK